MVIIMEYLFLKLWIKENKSALFGLQFDKIYQFEDRYFFSFYKHNKTLTVSLFPNDSLCFIDNIQLNDRLRQNSFINIISNHLKYSKISHIEIGKNDRIVEIFSQKINIYGDLIQYKLTFEFINHYENIILSHYDKDKDKWIIIDSHRKISFSENRYRQILPNNEYVYPPPLNKPDIFEISYKDFKEMLLRENPQNWRDFLKLFSGAPSFLCLYFQNEPVDELWKRIQQMKGIIENAEYKIYLITKKNYFSLSPVRKVILENIEQEFTTINEAFVYFYYKNIIQKKLDSHKETLLRDIDKQIRKIQIGLNKKRDAYSELEREQEWKHKAELLKANYHKLKLGMKVVKVIDYFVPEMPTISIPINERLSPEKNMNLYFKKYKKAKSGRKKLSEQIVKDEKGLKLLYEKKKLIQNITEYSAILDYVKHKESVPRKQKKRLFKRFYIDENWDIYIGRNNTENDILTTKFASPDDWFFHTKMYHGAHIIIRNKKKKEELPNFIKLWAAQLAAYQSKAKHSSHVPIDYTQIRYTSKPKGSQPGYIIYKNYKTIYVEPVNPQIIKKEIEAFRKSCE